MLALISYCFVFAFIGLVGAQNTSTTAFNPGTVDLATRFSWCRAQLNACPEICGGGNSANSCDENTLDFSCVCANGTTPDVSEYMNTIPFFVCQETYAQCINSHPNDLQGQQQCTDDAQCGTRNATSGASTSSSSSASSASGTAAASSSAAGSSASETASASGSATGTASGTASGSTASATGMAVKVGAEYGVGLLAALFSVVFKLLL